MSTTAGKDRPILFSGPMVRAILDGTKTETRRVVKPQPTADGDAEENDMGEWFWWDGGEQTASRCCPYGQPGERLWVRETFSIVDDAAAYDPEDGHLYLDTDDEYHYVPDKIVKRGPSGERWVVDYKCGDNRRIVDKIGTRKWKPSIHMPRWASRITLEVTGVRAERLQLIRNFRAEGFKHYLEFGESWDKMHDKSHSWNSDPWVWVVEFKLL